MIKSSSGDTMDPVDQATPSGKTDAGMMAVYPPKYEVVYMDSGKGDVVHEPTGPMYRPFHSADQMGSPMESEDGIAETGMISRTDRGARNRRER